VPSFSWSIIPSDLCVEKASTNVWSLGFELVHNHTFILFLRLFFNLGWCLSGDLSSDGNYPSTARNLSGLKWNLREKPYLITTQII